MDLSESDITARLELALSAAREAGRLTLKFFQQDNFQVERKADNSPVTIADRQAEQLLRRLIQEQFPADAIIGEEFGSQEGESEFCWILDPIDGTKSFISGVPLYGALVGVTHRGQSLIGVIDIPALDECVYAACGRGAWRIQGDQPPSAARVSSRSSLSEGLFVTSQVDTFDRRDAGRAFVDLQQASSLTRTWGDCYGYLLVATGRAEAMVDPMLNIWDAAALLPIIEEAGGKFTDWRGQPSIDSGDAIGSNGLVHDELLAITSAYPPPA